jgi:uncharacterized integral membrane protein
MRYFQAILLLVFLGAIGAFALQNTNLITVDFLNWRVSQPVALFSIAVYVLGMFSGWTMFSILKRSYRTATAQPPS